MSWVLSHRKVLAGTAVVMAAILAAILAAAILYRDGRQAGAAAVTGAVQAETIRKLEDARLSKEKTDEEVRRIPYDDRVDSLR